MRLLRQRFIFHEIFRSSLRCEIYFPRNFQILADVLRVGAVMSQAGGAPELVPFELLHLELVSQVEVFKL